MTSEQPAKVVQAAKQIGDDFAGWRKILGLTTQQVAERANITRDTLRKLEHGDPTVGFHVVLKVARALGPATLDELTELTEAMPERYRLLVLLAAWCDLRFGELTELRRHDVDTKGGVLRVRRGVSLVDGEFVVDTPKTAAGVRDVAIPPHLLPLVREHLLRHTAPGPEGLLFPSKNDPGQHLRQSSLARVYYPAREAAGRPDLRFHDLRHTGAVYAAVAGATVAELMARLGHSTPAAAMRYQHVAAGRDAEIAARLSAMAETHEGQRKA